MSHDGSIRASEPRPIPSEGSGPWVCTPLLGGVPRLVHGFTLRAAGDFTRPAPASELVRTLGARSLRLLRQVHGTKLAGPDDPGTPEADGWAGQPEPGVLLGIRTADCLPVLFCHPPTGVLGLAHAGWRGAAAGIAAKTLKRMGVPAEEILVGLGPAIGPCCYEVGEEVAAAVGRTRYLSPTGGARYRFDLPGYVCAQLVTAGVRPRHVERVALCTASRTDLLFSHRAEASEGRLCSFLGWSLA